MQDLIILWGARGIILVTLVYAIWHYIWAADACQKNGNKLGYWGYVILMTLASICTMGLIPEWLGLIDWSHIGAGVFGGMK